MINEEQNFYKFSESENYLYKSKVVHNKSYVLDYRNKDSYNLPIDGWYWFDSLQEACSFFQLNIEEYTDNIDLL